MEPQAGESERTGVATRLPPRRGAHEPGTPSGEEVTGGELGTVQTPHAGILVLENAKRFRVQRDATRLVMPLQRGEDVNAFGVPGV
ncbi:hypothetical protein [Halodesulfurarchaeum sp.]|uniref:hypothetical protein n=1 Tax=Halodesulfurarchaeum sp. TaxID=1980530 RepID=UPI002FC2BC29